MATKLINDSVDVMTTRELFKGYLLTERIFLLFYILLDFVAVILRLSRSNDMNLVKVVVV